MKKEILSRLPNVCILFILVLLGTALLNIWAGYGSSGWPVVMVFVWLVLFQAVDYLLSMIPFKSCRQYRVCAVAVNYVLVFAAWYWMGWLALTPRGILFFSLNYLIFYRMMQRYYEARQRAAAAEINRQLELRRKNQTPEEDANSPSP